MPRGERERRLKAKIDLAEVTAHLRRLNSVRSYRLGENDPVYLPHQPRPVGRPPGSNSRPKRTKNAIDLKLMQPRLFAKTGKYTPRDVLENIA